MTRSCLYLFLTSVFMVPGFAWSDGHIPSFLLRIPDSIATVFVAETSTAQFHRLNRVDGILEYDGNHEMSIGQEGAGKEKSGDKRTPLGIYFVTEELDTTRLHEKYGVVAFVLDYPNGWDQRLARSGGGIWVHGVDSRGGKRPALDTEGCISLANADLMSLNAAFQDNVTPVLIASEIEWRDGTVDTVLVDELEQVLEQWASSLASGDLHAYLSLYDDDFERWEMQKPAWSSFSLKSFAESVITDVAIDDLLLLGYPDTDGIYLSRFRQTLTVGETKTISMKRLYWRRNDDGALRIIVEDNG